MSINLKTLIGKLNETARGAATRAANLCMGMGHGEVDIEHLFVALLGQQDCDICTVARKCSISLTTLEADLRRELGTFKTGNERVPVFSRRLQLLLEHAWLIASLGLPQPGEIRSLHLLLALLTEPSLAQYAARASQLFGQFPVDELKHKPQKYLRGSGESMAATPDSERAGDAAGQLLRPTQALDQFTANLTRQAREGKLDPVVGRDAEIRQVIDILTRRRQNNPILTGEAGVGKTAIVEGLALRIAANDVPPSLQGVAIHVLDMGLLQAGASVKGEFESRLKNVIDEVKRSPHAIILFIDEAHSMIGAGGPAGQGDAANLLKPALARGELRTIAATTWSEYKKYFEKDAALARRFQVVKVDEPDEQTTASMLRAMVPLMENHFGVRVRDEAVTEAVRLSHRYITGRQLPDKAVSVLDTACARVALGQTSAPALLEDAARQIERLSSQIAALERDIAEGAVSLVPSHNGRSGSHRVAGPEARMSALRDERGTLLAWHGELAARWEREKALCAQIAASRDNGGTAQVAPLMQELRAMQADAPMVPLEVDGHTVAAVIAAWTGIPLGKMVRDEVRTVQQLRPALESRVLGQAHAIETVTRRMRIARANLEDTSRPKGVFLFTGPSGVGKTETALALADVLFGGERKLITINMSEYQEAHSISGLKGSPPGYVGFGEGGVLTEAVRRAPYSVVLLDEIDKAHADVAELFFQVFDKGFMEDAEGRLIDFRNAVIIMTSNLGSAAIMQACLNKTRAELPAPEQLDALVRPLLVRHFKPAFLGRLEVVPFYPVADDVLTQIIALKLGRIGQRVSDNYHAEFSWDEALLETVLARCTEVDSGARNIDNILNGTLLPDIADVVLARIAEGAPVSKIKASANRHGQFKLTIK
ncbi:type VI secretion system ATPase TssH [Pseudoduganella sp. RAF19]|uniref:type VI secretion system ATPase TssH n=1 Tax=Pseudoduganella sp. RAF19 TaxID=3233052 RepID=UPI003F987FE8